MENTKTMKSKSVKNVFGFFVAILALAFALPGVSADFGHIDSVYVNGIVGFPVNGSTLNAGVTAGETMDVRVVFTASQLTDDVRVVARILGEPGLSDVTERFDVIAGNQYSRLLSIQLPYNIDPDELFTLEVTVESQNDSADNEASIPLSIQRSNYRIEILSVDYTDSVKAGDNLPVDVVIKNRGRHFSEDTFVTASIPALGISKKVFFGDLSPEDQGGNVHENEDALSGKIFLLIPRNAPAGVYDLNVESFGDDAKTVVTRKVVIVGSGVDSNVISSATSKTFAVGEEKIYTVTIVNADNKIKVYDLILDGANGLTVDFDESVVAVPAGTSKTVQFKVSAAREGAYNFAVNVHSDGELVKKQNFVANVEGKKIAGGNAAVVLTIILAIVFVVLLVVLIVLLTRKPEKSENFGESYY